MSAEEWTCDWKPDELNPGPECPYCAGEMCARFDALNCTHDLIERHGDPTEVPELTPHQRRYGPHDCRGGAPGDRFPF